MAFDDILRWFHLIAAAVWVGGLITTAALISALRQAGAERPLLQAAARRFGVVSWSAIGVAVLTGFIQYGRLDEAVTDDGGFTARLAVKLALVGLAVGLAAVHQATARRTSPAVRGLVEGAILLTSLGIVALAVVLI